MKIKIPKSQLQESLGTVQNVAIKNAEPILMSVLINADDGRVYFVTTDKETIMRCYCSADVEEPGKITLPAKKVSDVVKELKDGVVTLETTDNGFVNLSCGSYRSKMVSMPADLYPETPDHAAGDYVYSISQSKFKDMLKKTCYAASTDNSKGILSGVLLDFSDGKLTCVATDTRRLALYETEVEFAPENKKDVVLPSKAVSELIRVLRDDGDVMIAVKDNKAMFEFDNMFFACTLLQGTYPNYRQVVFPSCEHRIGIDREELLTVLRRVSVCATSPTSALRLKFADNVLTVSSNNPEVGEASDTIAVKYDGPEISALFNPEFLMDPLKNLTSDSVYIELNNSVTPGLIKSDIQFLYVIMPLRI